MNKIILLALFCIVALLQGCSVFSINPIATPENTIIDPNLVGTWQLGEMILKVTLNKNEKLYDIESEAEKSSNFVGIYQGKLVRINENLFFQIYPQDMEKTFGVSGCQEINPWFLIYLQPVYGFLHIKDVNETQIEFTFLRDDGLSKYLKNKDIAYQSPDKDRLLLTDTTEKLCSLMSELVDCNAEDIWDTETFKRVIDKVGVYDSRAIAIAYTASKYHKELFESLIADAKDDEELAKTLDSRMQALQEKRHAQGFGTESVRELLGPIGDQLKELVEKKGVTRLISKWEYKGDVNDVIDLTDDIVEYYHPSEKTLESIKSIKTRMPVGYPAESR